MVMSRWFTGLWCTYPSEKYEWKSVGMMKFPTEWTNNIHVPNHQPGYYMEISWFTTHSILYSVCEWICIQIYQSIIFTKISDLFSHEPQGTRSPSTCGQNFVPLLVLRGRAPFRRSRHAPVWAKLGSTKTTDWMLAFRWLSTVKWVIKCHKTNNRWERTWLCLT